MSDRRGTADYPIRWDGVVSRPFKIASGKFRWKRATKEPLNCVLENEAWGPAQKVAGSSPVHPAIFESL